MNDFRKYMDLVESSHGEEARVDERGGMLDKFAAGLSKVPGMSDIASAAGARVKEKDIYPKIRDAWVKYATHEKVNKKDSVAFKSYLTDFLELDPAFVEGLPGLDGPKADLKVALQGVSAEMAKYSDKMPGKGKGKVKSGQQVKRSDLDPKIVAYMRNQLKGNDKNVLQIANQIKRQNKIAELRKQPLALMGYLVLEDAGYLD